MNDIPSGKTNRSTGTKNKEQKQCIKNVKGNIKQTNQKSYERRTKIKKEGDSIKTREEYFEEMLNSREQGSMNETSMLSLQEEGKVKEQ